MSAHSQDRRSFVTRISTLSAMAVLTPSTLTAESHPQPAAPWDLSWMESLKGKHKQVFDFGGISWAERGSGETPLRVPRNWLNAHKEVYGLESPAVNTIIGIAYSAFPLNAVDAVWQKYSLGERWKIKDGETGMWAVRNVFSNASAPY